MTKEKQRTVSDRLRDLLEALKDTLTPRQPAPAPVPVRPDWRPRHR